MGTETNGDYSVLWYTPRTGKQEKGNTIKGGEAVRFKAPDTGKDWVLLLQTPLLLGNAPSDERELVKSFLKDDRFVIISPNDYNALQVGTSQLYNERRVYNYKRHGVFKLGSRTFRFVRKPYVPAKMTKELLLVDLVNNAKQLAEDQPHLMEHVKRRTAETDSLKLKQLANNFGTVGTRKLFTSLSD